MKFKYIYIVLIILSLFPLAGLAQEAAKKDLSSMTVDDVINLEKPYHLRISPDSTRVLWEQKRVDEDTKKYISDVWVSPLKKGEKPARIVKGGKFSEWSPDGKKIAFLSDRSDDVTQIFVIPSTGGEAEKLFKSEIGVDAFKWKDDKTIIFLARENKYYYEKQLKETDDDAEVVEDMKAFVPYRLFSYSIEDKKTKRLTDNKDQINDFIISPDGKWAVTVNVDSPLYGNDPKYFKKYYLLSLSDLSIKQIFTDDKYFSPHDFEWAKDGILYMLEDKSDYADKQAPGMPLLYWYDSGTNTYKEIPLNWPNGIGLLSGRALATGGGNIGTTLAGGVVNHFVILNKNGKEWSLNRIEDPRASNFETFDLCSDGKGIVFVSSTASELPQVYYGKIEGHSLKDVITLTKLNKDLDNVFLAKREIIKWKSDGGREIEGILFYPKDYTEGKKYPLVTSIHGGPSWYDSDIFDTSWAYYPHILAAKNSFVLEVNYSGSANYGLPFLESIFGHYYELEVPDIMSGVDYLIGKGMVDPQKLGTMGWSNGSILSIALTTETTRFKVACCGAGDVNWMSDYGNCGFGVSFDNLYLKGPYWENLDHYIAKSPLFKMQKVITPTLIMFGGSDTSVPTEQGYEHYRALQQLGNVPVRFILMPGEPHSLGAVAHQKRKMKEELAWFDKYLFTETAENRSFKEGSPLDTGLKKSDFKYDGNGNLGIMEQNTLIPETLDLDGLQAGRFEVTRAQFSVFLLENKDIDAKKLTGWSEGGFKPGTGNYPVSGLNLSSAVKYCKWLSEKTGKNYRLPTAEEMEKWLGECSGDENNLDYWIGYSLSPDEAFELEEYIAKMEAGTGLILPVASFAASFDKIYDINGNVSELCSDGTVKGLSARHISDKKEHYKPPAATYTGFRVIRESKIKFN